MVEKKSQRQSSTPTLSQAARTASASGLPYSSAAASMVAFFAALKLGFGSSRLHNALYQIGPAWV
jgi:hypothetical protein